jgi:2-oxoisovalerate dehydrogenase E1 component
VTGGVMARRHRGIPSVGFAFIGDGGTSTGDFHEAVNFAAVKQVPVIFIIENNHYAYSTPSNEQYRCRHLVDRAIGYGIEGHQIDGNDACAMYELLRDIAADIREHPRAVLVEADTMRMRGHGEHDDFSYVPRDLLDSYRARDPIEMCRCTVADRRELNDADWHAFQQATREEVDAAFRAAMSEPGPSPDSLLEGVYEPG